MNCPECESPLTITHVYRTPSGKTSAAACTLCHRRYTFVTFLVGEIKKTGDGPFAVAKRLRDGADPRSL